MRQPPRSLRPPPSARGFSGSARPGATDMTAAPARLFVALWPDAGVRAALAACRDACAWPARAAPVATPKLHLTLHFIGDVAAERLPEIVQGLRVPAQRFELVLERCVAWPGGLVVLQPSETPEALLALHAACAGALRALELPVQRRPLRAHVTLARHASGARLAPPAPLRWPIDGCCLVRSHRADDGRYEVLARCT